MTDLGRERTDQYYGPLVLEGLTVMDKLSEEQLRFMDDLLASITALTDRHRAGVATRPAR